MTGSGEERSKTNSRLVARGGSTPTAIRVSWRPDAWSQYLGESGGYQLRWGVGGYCGRGYGGYRRRRRV